MPLGLAVLVGSPWVRVAHGQVPGRKEASPAPVDRAAEESGSPSTERTRWVVLETAPGLAIPVEQLRADLEAGLAPLGACVVLGEGEISGAAEPTAEVSLLQTGPGVVTVEVKDHLTHKRLARDIDLQSIPADGHALTLALAADELLRASWAELELARDQAKPETARPGEKEPATISPSEPPRPWFVLVGPRVSHFSRGSTFVGGDLSVGRRFEAWQLEAHLVAQGALDRRVATGEVSGQAFGGAMDVGYGFGRPNAWTFGPEMGVEALAVSFTGRPTGSNEGSSLGGLSVSLKGGGFLSLESERLKVTLAGSVGYAVSSVLAQADGKSVAGVAGAEVGGSLRVGVMF